MYFLNFDLFDYNTMKDSDDGDENMTIFMIIPPVKMESSDWSVAGVQYTIAGNGIDYPMNCHTVANCPMVLPHG
jgi:hypothetical protein